MLLKELWNYNHKLFLCPPQKHNQHSMLLLFKINLHFGTSGKISKCRKLIFLPIDNIYLVFFSREMQILVQTKVATTNFFYCLKRNISQTCKSRSCKKIFHNCVYHSNNLLRCFLFHMITERHYFLFKFIVTKRFCAMAMLLHSLKQVFWKKSAFHLHIALQGC